MLPAARFLLSLTLLFSAAACGEPTTVGQSPTIAPSSTWPLPTASDSPLPSPTATGPWKTYSDPKYGFKIEYPPDFLFEASKGVASNSTRAGRLAFVRFFDQRFSEGNPAGQVELAIYTKDASTLEGWLDKHSSDSFPDDSQIYYNQVSNQDSITANGRPAIAFDWQAVEIGAVHVVAFFIDNRVIELDWFADDPAYAGTIEPIFDRMLESFEG